MFLFPHLFVFLRENMAVETGILVGLGVVILGIEFFQNRINDDMSLVVFNRKYDLSGWLKTWFQYLNFYTMLTLLGYIVETAVTYNFAFSTLFTIFVVTLILLIAMTFLGFVGKVFVVTKDKMSPTPGDKFNV